MKLTILPLAAALALTGCAHTTKGYREQAPRFELSSDKEPQVILGCITEAWQRAGRNPQYSPLPTGGTVSVPLPTLLISFGNLEMLVDVEAVNGKTRVRYFRMSSIVSDAYQSAEADIRRCS